MATRQHPDPAGLRHIVRRLRAAVACLLTAWLVTGCALSTKDIRKPLIVDLEKIPQTAAEVAPLNRSGASGAAVESALQSTRSAVDIFTTVKYDQEFNRVYLADLIEAVNSFPGNAFAWSQLASYFSLMSQPRAAIAATEHALRLLEELPETEASRFQQLWNVSLINLSGSRISEGEYGLAVIALGQVKEPEALDPFRRLAYEWASAQALAGNGDPDAAREALERARQVPPPATSDYSPDIWVWYPQYFKGKMRAGNFEYIEGLIALAEGDAPEAITALSRSERRHSKLWESSFVLANALFENGQSKEAAQKLRSLEGVLDRSPNLFFRRERVSFNLGNIYMSQGEVKPAIEAYERAIRAVRTRAASFRDRVAPSLSAEDIHHLVLPLLEESLSKSGEIFPEAYTNLGNAYYQLARTSEAPEALLEKAEQSYRMALESTSYHAPYVARANLARLHWDQGRYHLALAEMALALGTRPSYEEGLERLQEMASSASTTEISGKAYSILLDALSRLGPSKLVSDRFGPWLQTLRERLEKADGPEARRALARSYALQGEAAATHLYEAAAQAFPGTHWPLIGLARLELEKEAPDVIQAEEWLSMALMLPRSSEEAWGDPDWREGFYLRGKLRLARGDQSGARSDFVRALELSPQWEPAALGLASIAEPAVSPPASP